MKVNGNWVASGRLIGLVFGVGMENKSKDLVVETKQILIKDEDILDFVENTLKEKYPTVDEAMGLEKGTEIGKQFKSKKIDLFVKKGDK